ncbi:MAG: hypothetical protein ABH833_04690 [Parcubacteria group bacterium]
MSKTVKYRVLIKSDGNYYKLGTIIIKRFEGDIIYAPSQLKVIGSSSTGTLDNVIDHVSWHPSGRVHVKIKDDSYEIFEEGIGVLNSIFGMEKDRQRIKDIGFQEILRDTVIDIATLPEHKKKIDKLDIVFDIKDYDGPVQFYFSMVSGTHIVELAEGGKTPVKISKKSIKLRLDGQHRSLGVESGNADKLLQYNLYRYVGKDLQKGRRLFVAADSGISKIQYDE